jgi:hypothetical protein
MGVRTTVSYERARPTFATLTPRGPSWAKAERWERMRQVLLPPVEADALLLLDSTIIEAHPHAAGARKVGSEARDGALGRSRVGFTTKLHGVVSMFGSVKRRVATRYDKIATSYGSFAATAALCTRLSGWAA